jgi:hypothetical protein
MSDANWGNPRKDGNICAASHPCSTKFREFSENFQGFRWIWNLSNLSHSLYDNLLANHSHSIHIVRSTIVRLFIQSTKIGMNDNVLYFCIKDFHSKDDNNLLSKSKAIAELYWSHLCVGFRGRSTLKTSLSLRVAFGWRDEQSAALIRRKESINFFLLSCKLHNIIIHTAKSY